MFICSSTVVAIKHINSYCYTLLPAQLYRGLNKSCLDYSSFLLLGSKDMVTELNCAALDIEMFLLFIFIV